MIFPHFFLLSKLPWMIFENKRVRTLTVLAALLLLSAILLVPKYHQFKTLPADNKNNSCGLT